jgi:hypothetical protein
VTRDDRINLALLVAAFLFVAIDIAARWREHEDAAFAVDVTKPFLNHGVDLP